MTNDQFVDKISSRDLDHFAGMLAIKSFQTKIISNLDGNR